MVEEIVEMLGGKKVLGKLPTGKLALADAIEEGLPFRALEHLKAALGLSDLEAANNLGISQKTISRMRKTPGKRMGKVPSDRLVRLAHLYAQAVEVLEDEDAARDWLKSPQVGLNNRVPLDLADTEVGAREVAGLLGRIEHGVIS